MLFAGSIGLPVAMGQTLITSTTLPAAGSVSSSVVDQFSIGASANVQAASGSDSANYDLREAGPDQAFGSGDDILYPLSPTVSGTNVMFQFANSPLQPGRYRFTTKSGLLNASGAAITPFSREFTLVHPVNGRIETISNDRLEEATALPVAETPAGSKFYTAVGVGAFSSGTDVDFWRFDAEAGDRITVRVVSDLSNSGAQVQLRNAADGFVTSGSSSGGVAALQDYTMPAPGTFYLRVSGNRAANYTLRLDQSRGPQLETEGNDTVTAADEARLTSLAGSYSAALAGSLEAGDGIDYFSLGHLTAGDNIAVNSLFPAGSTLNAGTIVVKVYRAGVTGALATSQNGLLNYATAGDGVHYLSVETSGTGGFRAQYLLSANIADRIAPRVVSVSLPDEGGSTQAIVNEFTVQFSEDMNPALLRNSANYEMRNAGRDGQFNTADDELYVVANESYAGGLSATFTLPDGPLQPGMYMARINTGISDRAGNALAAALVRRFAVVALPGYPSEGRNNDSLAGATPVGTVTSKADLSYSPVVSLPVGNASYSIDQADFNKDGYLDLVVANYSSKSVTLLLGRAGGQFADGVEIPVDGNPYFVRGLDLNNDQRTDIATANSGPNSLTVLLANGDGSFTPRKIDLGGGPTTFATGDFNRDGRIDFVTAYGRSISFIPATGNGPYGAEVASDVGLSGPYGVTAADVNGDNILDVLVANQNNDSITVLIGKGDGTFSAGTPIATGDRPRHVRAIDWDGDGDLDLAVLCAGDNRVDIFRNDGTGVFGQRKGFEGQGSDAYDLRLADLDGDGSVDILLGEYGQSRVTVLRNLGRGDFGPAMQFSIPGNPISVVAGDFNKDGILDIATANYGGRTATVLQGNPLKQSPQDSALPELRIVGGRGSLANLNDVDYWSLSVNAGEIMTVAIETGANSSGLFIQLLRPEGQRVESFYGSGNGNGQMRPYTFPTSGTYYLAVSYNYQYFGEYRWRAVITGGDIQHEVESNDSANQANAPLFSQAGTDRVARVMGLMTRDDATPGDYFTLGTAPAGTPVNVSLKQASISAFAPTLELLTGSTVVATATGGQSLSYMVPAGPDVSLLARVRGADGNGALGIGSIYVVELKKGGEASPPHVVSVDLPEEGTLSERLITRFRVVFDEEVDGVFNGLGRKFVIRGGSAYAISPGTMNWGAATSFAATLGGSLVTIDDAAENEFLRGQFSAQGNFWTGLNDATDEGIFKWAGTGAGLTYSNWGPNEPSNSSDRDYAAVNYWGQWYLAGNANNLAVVEVSSQDSDGDGVPDAADPYPHDGLNGFDLRNSGPDGVFGTGDDQVFAITSAGYTGGLNADLLIQDGPLPAGNYRLRVTRSVTDKAGNGLEQEYVRRFAIRAAAGVVLEGVNNDSLAGATALAGTPTDRADGSFTIGSQAKVNANPYAICAGDFNEDGRIDLATADYSGNTASVLLGRGDGTFQVARTQAVDRNPIFIVSGDFNRDGHADLATANSSGRNVSLLFGAGDGSFAPAVNFDTGNNPRWLATGDLDGDGFLDLVVANNSSANATIIFGIAQGQPRMTTVALGNSPRGVAVADFNKDGKLDIVSVNESENTLAFLAGLGTGAFADAVKTMDVTRGQALRVADVNGDGNLDCVVLNGQGTTVDLYLGDGKGGFAKGKTYSYGSGSNYDFIVRDLDGDGSVDIAVANYSQNRISVLLGAGAGRFGGVIQTQGSGNPISLVSGDFNRDGILDLASADYSGSTVSIYLGNRTKLLPADAGIAGLRTVTARGALLNRDDADYWSFSGVAGQTVFIATETPGVTSAASELFRLYRSNGEQVASFYSNGNGVGQSQPVVLPVSGTYFLLVTYNNEFTGEYRFRVLLADPPIQAENESNNTVNSANNLAFDTQNGERHAQVAGVLTRGDTGDFIGLGVVPVGSPIELSLKMGAESGIVPGLELYFGTKLVASSADGSVKLSYTVPLTSEGAFAVKVTGQEGSKPLGLSANYLLDVIIKNEQVPPVIRGVDLPGDGSVSTAIIDHFNLQVSEDLDPRINRLNRAFIQYRSSFYALTSRSLPWLAAEAEAQTVGGHLATVNDQAENEWLIRNFAAPFWIGLTDQEEEGTFVWISGEPVTFTSWSGGEPNNSGDEDFTEVYSNGTWNDLGPGSSFFGVIEIPAGTADSDGDGIPDAIDPYPSDKLNVVDLRAAGNDGVFGTTDDLRYAVQTVGYEGGTNVTFTIQNSPLPPGQYRLTITRSLTDLAGNSITQPYVRLFSVAPVPPYSLEGGSNNSFREATSLAGMAGAPNGSFRIGDSVQVGNRISATVTADFNRDGKLDLIVANHDGASITVFLSGTGQNMTGVELATGNNPYYLLAGDFNRDGRMDVAVANRGSASVSVFIGKGDGTFNAPATFGTGNAPWMLAAGDLNGDGYPEIISANYNSHNVTVIDGLKTWTAGTTKNYAAGTNARGLSVGDVNGDGSVDVLVACAGEDNLALLAGDGTGALGLPVKIEAGDDPRFVELSDLNGDGALDWVVINCGSSTLDTYFGDGKGGFLRRDSVQISNTDAYQMLLTDLNGDGRKDVLIVSYSPSNLTLLLNAGGGVFATPVVHSFSGNPLSASVGDFDNDGVLDIVAGNYGQSSLTYLFGSRASFLAGNDLLGTALGSGRGNLSNGNDVDYFTFTGKAGQQVILVAETPGAGSASGLTFRLYRPGGVEIANANGGSPGFASLGPVTLPVDGNYFIGISPYYNYFGEYRFRVLLAGAETVLESESNDKLPGNSLPFTADGSVRKAEVIGTAMGGGDVDYFNLGSLQPGNKITLTARRPDSTTFPLSLALLGADGRELLNPVIQSDTLSYIVPPGGAEVLSVRVNAFPFAPGLSGSDADRYSIYLESGDYVTVEDAPALRPQSVSVEGWFNFVSASGTQVLISKPVGTSVYNSYALWYDGSQLNGIVGDASGNGPTVRYAWRPEVGRWYHLAYVFDDAYHTQSLMIDGEMVASGTVNKSIGYDEHPLLIGAESERENITYFFRGNVDEVRVWGLARTAAEIKATRNLRLSGQEAGLRGYWRFDEGAGAMAADRTGKNKPGRFVGSPDWVPAAAAFNPGSVLAQYKLIVQIDDVGAPAITGTTLVADGAVDSRLISRIQVSFSEELDPGFARLNRSLFSRNGHGYWITPDGLSWIAAQELAAQLGGHLVVVDDESENAWLRDTFGFAGNFWIGLSDRRQEGQFVWEAGQVSSYTSWAANEPRDTGDEDFVAMNANGLWSDVKLFSNYRAVIEFEGPDRDGDGLPDVIDPVAQGPLNYFDLREAGRDGLFDTSDDQVYWLAPGDYTGGLTVDLLLLNGPLAPGRYRFSATTALRDRSGNALGTPLTRFFTIEGAPGYLTEPQMNDDFSSATPLNGIAGGTLFGRYEIGPTFDVASNPYFIADGDVNGDGVADLVVPNYGAASVQVWFGDSLGGFNLHQTISTANGPVDVEIRDFNKDGRPDIAIANYSSARLSVALGTATGDFQAPAAYTTANTPFRVVSGDFDGDKNIDLAVAHLGNRGLAAFFGDGQGGFSGPSNIVTSASVRGLSVGDLNGDGRDDLFFTTESPGRWSEAFGLANRAFEVKAFTDLPGDGRVAILTELNGKAGVDAVVITGNSRAIILSNDGAGNLTERGNFPTGISDPYEALVEDLNGDGLKDIAVSGYGNNRVAILEQLSDSTLTAPVLYTVSSGPIGLVTGDFDKNGVKDLLVGLYGSGAITRLNGFAEAPLASDGVNPSVRQGGGRGTLTSKADIDYWRFYARAGDSIQAAIESGSSSGTLYAVLYGPNHQNLAQFNAGSGRAADSGNLTAPASGTYFIAVNSNTEWVGEYKVRATVVEPPSTLENENNNSINNASPLVFVQEGQTRRALAAGYVSSANDLDYFALGNLEAGSTVYLNVRLIGSSNPLIPVVALYDAANGYVPEAEGGQAFDSVGEIRIQRAGAYFALVRGIGTSSGLAAQYVLEAQTVPTGSISFPNLQVTGITLPQPAQVLSGRAVTVRYSVRNSGASATPVANWLDRVSLSANEFPGDGDDLVLGSFPHAGALAAGAGYDGVATVDIPNGLQGAYYVIVSADSNQQVPEFLFEGDNARVSDGTLTISLPPYADLVVEDLSVAIGATGPLAITWKTANRGTGETARPFKERIVVRNLGTGALVGLPVEQETTQSLAAGGVLNRSFSLPRPPSGRYEVMVTTDSADDIFEYNSSGHANAELNGFAAPFDLLLVNLPPTIGGVPEQTVPEDGTLKVTLSVDDGETGAASVFVSAKASNLKLFPPALVSLSGSGNQRVLTLQPAANLSGSSLITVTASDGLLESQIVFLVRVLPVNDPPTISSISAIEFDEDQTSFPVPFTIDDLESDPGALILSATSSNPTLIPVTGIGFSGSGATRAVVLKPAPDRFGQSLITVRVSDGEQSATASFLATVRPVNDAPTISELPDVATRPGVAVGPIEFKIGDIESPASTLVVTVASSDEILLPLTGLEVGGSGELRTIKATPAAGRTGAARVSIMVSDPQGASATASFELIVSEASLLITTHPKSQSIAEGSDLSLSVRAVGVGPLKYQWYLNGAPISGETNRDYTVTSAPWRDTGVYFAEVSDQNGTVRSREAKVRVMRGILIDSNPVSQTVPPGANAAFSVKASGAEPLTYQWYFGGAIIPDGTSATLLLPAVRPANAGDYYVVITNPFEQKQSAPATLTVADSVRLSVEPDDQLIKVGDTLTLSAEASKTASYQWYFRGQPIPVTTSTYTKANAALSDSGDYRVEVRDIYGAAFSRIIRVIVVAAPVITKQPIPQTVALGRSTKLGVIVSGTEPLEFEWFRNGTSIGKTPGPVLELVNVGASAEGDYTVRVSNIAGAVTSSAAHVTVIAGVQIAGQPTAQTRSVGDSVTLTVDATGTALNYQWYYRGVPIPGATGPTYTIPNASITDSGSYSVEISNLAGAVRSVDASLKVLAAPAITRQPQAQDALVGGAAKFSVGLSGSEPLSVQWTLNGVEIPGATAPLLILNNLQPAQEGDYRALVRNDAGLVVSDAARLRVHRAITITSQPVGGTVRMGDPFQLTVVATGSDPIGYQWQRNGYNIPGATAATYAAMQPGRYAVRVFNPAGGVLSDAVEVRVIRPVSFVRQPVGLAVKGGGSAVLKVVAEGSGMLTYQWQVDGKDVPGATWDTLILRNIEGTAAKSYRVLVSNEIGSALSDEAMVTVLAPPTILTQPLSQLLTIGADLSLSVAAEGAPPLSYQWAVNGVSIAGATGPTLSLSNLQPTDLGNYSVTVSNPGGAVRSSLASITMLLPDLNLADNRADAPASSQAVAVFSGSNVGATREANEPDHALNQAAAASVWFRWIAPFSGVVTFTTAGSGFDTILAAYQLNAQSQLEQLASDEDSGPFKSSTFQMNAVEGTTYFIAIDGYKGATGNVVIGWVLLQNQPKLPRITKQPVGFTALVGGAAQFSVQAEAADANGLIYQWFFGSLPLIGQNGSVLNLSNVQISNVGNYSVSVSNAGDPLFTVFSVPAPLQINLIETQREGPDVNTLDKLNPANASQLPQSIGTRRLRILQSVARGFTGSQVFSTVGAVRDESEPNHCNASGGASAWSLYEAPANGSLEVTTDGSFFDTVVAVYSGSGDSFDSLVLLGCDDNGGADGQDSRIVVPVTAGGLYFIVVDGVHGASGIVQLNYTLSQPPVVVQQPAVAGIQLQSQGPVPEGANVTLQVVATNLSQSAQSYQWRFNGENIAGGTNQSLTLNGVTPASGGSYTVSIGNFAGATQSETLALSVLSAATIVTPLQNLTVAAGGSAVFTVAANGTEPLQYEWRLNGAVIPGETTSTLALTNAQSSGTYEVRVSNAANSVTSQATLTVLQPVSITQQPANTQAAVNGSANFQVSATGSGTVGYQWRFNGVNLSGQTAPQLTLQNLIPQNAGGYSVLVSNEVSTVVSGEAMLDVIVPVSIVQQPQAQTISGASMTEFEVITSGTEPISYQWRFNGNPISGATARVLTLTDLTPASAGNYSVVVSNAGGSVTSANALLTITAPPTISQQPQNQSVPVGGNASFTVVAAGSGTLNYQWRFNGVHIAGQTSPTLTLNNLTLADAGEYSVAIDNAVGSIVSSAAVLTVNSAVTIVQQPSSVTTIEGSSVSFQVLATGSGPLQFRWMKNGALINGATNEILTLADVQAADAANYQAMVSNPGSTNNSSVAALTVQTLPAIMTHPKSKIVNDGSPTFFTVVATGSAPLSYEWRFNGVPMLAETNATLQIAAAGLEHEGTYSVQVSNPAGTAVSGLAVLSINRGDNVVLAARIEANEIVLALTGPEGRDCDIEASQDFGTWTVIGTVTLNGGQAESRQPSGSPAFRFYRAALKP